MIVSTSSVTQQQLTVCGAQTAVCAVAESPRGAQHESCTAAGMGAGHPAAGANDFDDAFSTKEES